MRLKLTLSQINHRYPYLKVILLIVAVTVFALMMSDFLRPHLDRMLNGETEQIESPDVSEAQGGQGTEKTEPEPETGASEEEQPAEPEQKDPEKTEPEASAEKPVEQPAPQQSATPVAVPQNTGRKIIALTFDDGPSNATTPRLLDILAAKGVKATFFVLGTRAQGASAVLQREAAEGHEVESHTLEHANLSKLSADGVRYQVAQADAIIQGIIGTAPALVRPPYGSINAVVRANIGKPMILWTIDPEDWKVKNAATVRQRVVEKAFDGAIVLMHDIHATTVDAVAGIIDDLRAAGYEFLTVSEMAQERGVVLQNGVSYGSFRGR